MDRPLPVAQCKAGQCRAPIVFARSTATGNPMPFDAEPGTTGEWMIGVDLFDQPVAWHLLGRDRVGNHLYTPHWATCPAAEEFRRRAALGQV